MSGVTDPALAADYDALRTGAGARRLDRDVLLVVGAEAEAYLQGQLSQDVVGMAPGEARDALLLEPDGKLCAFVRAICLGPGRFAVDTDAGSGEAVAARLRRFRLRTKVDLEPVAWPCVGIRGPDASSAVAASITGGAVGATPGGGDALADEDAGPWVVPFAWGGVVGVDVLGPGASDAVDGGVRWCDAPAWEALRIEAGVPRMGQELDGRTIAAEADLVARAVSFTKGCYTGQELVARLDARGNRVARHLRGLVPTAGATLEPGTELFDAGRPTAVGRCTSAAWCPGLGGPGGLGYVHRSVGVGGILAAGAPDGPPVEVGHLPLVAP